MVPSGRNLRGYAAGNSRESGQSLFRLSGPDSASPPRVAHVTEGRPVGPVLRPRAEGATWAALGRDVARRGGGGHPSGPGGAGCRGGRKGGGREAPHRCRGPPDVPAWARGGPPGRAPRVRRGPLGRGRPAPDAVPPGPRAAAERPAARHRVRRPAGRCALRPLPRRGPLRRRGQGARPAGARGRARTRAAAGGGEAADAAGAAGLRVRAAAPHRSTRHRLGALAVHAPADGAHPALLGEPATGHGPRRRALRDVRRVRRAEGQPARAPRSPAV